MFAIIEKLCCRSWGGACYLQLFLERGVTSGILSNPGQVNCTVLLGAPNHEGVLFWGRGVLGGGEGGGIDKGTLTALLQTHRSSQWLSLQSRVREVVEIHSLAASQEKNHG